MESKYKAKKLPTAHDPSLQIAPVSWRNGYLLMTPFGVYVVSNVEGKPVFTQVENEYISEEGKLKNVSSMITSPAISAGAVGLNIENSLVKVFGKYTYTGVFFLNSISGARDLLSVLLKSVESIAKTDADVRKVLKLAETIARQAGVNEGGINRMKELAKQEGYYIPKTEGVDVGKPVFHVIPLKGQDLNTLSSGYHIAIGKDVAIVAPFKGDLPTDATLLSDGIKVLSVKDHTFTQKGLFILDKQNRLHTFTLDGETQGKTFKLSENQKFRRFVDFEIMTEFMTQRGYGSSFLFATDRGIMVKVPGGNMQLYRFEGLEGDVKKVQLVSISGDFNPEAGRTIVPAEMPITSEGTRFHHLAVVHTDEGVFIGRLTESEQGFGFTDWTKIDVENIRDVFEAPKVHSETLTFNTPFDFGSAAKVYIKGLLVSTDSGTYLLDRDSLLGFASGKGDVDISKPTKVYDRPVIMSIPFPKTDDEGVYNAGIVLDDRGMFLSVEDNALVPALPSRNPLVTDQQFVYKWISEDTNRFLASVANLCKE